MFHKDAQMPLTTTNSSADHSGTRRGFRGLLIAAAAALPMLLGCTAVADDDLTIEESGASTEEGLADAAVAGASKALPGRIQAEDYKNGGEGVGYHDTTSGNQGAAYRTDSVDIQPKETNDGFNVGWITAGEWLAYDVSVASAGTYELKARVASGVGGTKKLHVEIDGKNVGSATFTTASGWQSWYDVNIGDVALSAGAHTLKLVADTAGFNLNYLDVSAPDHAMWIGAAVNRPDNNIGSFLSASSALGPWRIRRSFTPGLPTHINETDAKTDVANNVITFHSVKPPTISGVAAGQYDTKLKSLAKSFPTDHTTYLTMYHEPENDMTGAQFVSMFRHFYKVVKAANPHILVGTVHMSYHWRPGSSTTQDPAAWWVGSAYTDFIGVDDYNEATKSGRTTVANDPQFQRWYSWAAAKDKPLAVVEFGRLENPSDSGACADDLLDTEAWLKDHGFFMFLYWNAIGDKNIDWRLKNSATKEAMRDIAERGLTGW
jgi:hypothetical protein